MGLQDSRKRRKPISTTALVYPQSGWRILDIREIRERSRRNGKRLVLRLAHLGVFKLIVHRSSRWIELNAWL